MHYARASNRRRDYLSIADPRVCAVRMAALSDLTLYHYPVTRSARVLWLLHELGLEATGPVKVRRVELLEGEGRAEWCDKHCVSSNSRCSSALSLCDIALYRNPAAGFLRSIPTMRFRH